MSSPPEQLVLFTLREQRYGLALAAVEQVVRIVDITPLPKAPDIVLGVVNVQGRVVPVVNVSRRFGLPESEMALTDRLIVVRTPRRLVALVVDGVAGVLEYSAQEVSRVSEVLPGIEHLAGVVTCAVQMQIAMVEMNRDQTAKGLPRDYTKLLAGGPGAGKTVVAIALSHALRRLA